MSDPWFDEPQHDQNRTRQRSNLASIDEMPLAVRGPSLPQHQQQDLAELAALARSAPPRDLQRLLKEARDMGRLLGADLDDEGEGTAAYYRWKQGGKYIEGPTIDMMDALANMWGGLVYSVHMIGDPRGDRVHLRGRVLDLLRIVAHERDYIGWIAPTPRGFQGEQAGRWLAMQMQSAESKAMRGVLEHVIPRAVINAAMEAAKDAAAEARLMGRSLDDAVAKSIKALDSAGISDIEQLTRWVGRPPGQWTAIDLGELRAVYQRAKRGELPADAFRVEAAQRAAAREPETTTPTDGDRFNALGLGDTPPPPSQPGPQTPSAPSPPPDAGADVPPAEAEPPAGPPQAQQDAELLARVLVDHKAPAQVETTAKSLFREAAGLKQVSTERWTNCVRYGVDAGLFVRANGSLTVPRASATPDDIPPSVSISIREWEDAIGLARAAEIASAAGVPTPGDVPTPETRAQADAYLAALKAAQ